MPIYEFICKSCDNRFEQLQRTMNAAASNGAKARCPECGSVKTQRALSVFAVGAEASRAASAAPDAPGMCGRCGGPGPCAIE